MNIKIEKLHESDYEGLFEFEQENRAYFEGMIPSRGDEYYSFANFKNKNKTLLDEQSKGLSYFYLIKNEEAHILGRINLVDIDKDQGLGHIGYRVGESYTGKGIANKSVNLLLKAINTQEIQKILAKTTTNNIASQRILSKNGFKHISTSNETFAMNGENVRFVYYQWMI